MPVNKELLCATLDKVEEMAEKGLWEQRWWRIATECGTSYCFAGWACVLHYGDKELSDETISQLAGKILGLHEGQEYALFNARNTLQDLERIVCEIIREDSKSDLIGE